MTRLSIRVAVLTCLLVTTSPTAPRVLAQPATMSDSFAVVLGPGQSMDLAVGFLMLARPDLEGVIQRVVTAQQHVRQSGMAPAGVLIIATSLKDIVALAQASLTDEIQAKIWVEKSGLADKQTGQQPGGPGEAVHVPSVSGYFTFRGEITLTGFLCNPNGCTIASHLVSVAVWDQGYSTVKTAAKTYTPDGGYVDWTSKSAAASCYRGSSRCDVTGTQYLNVSGTDTIVKLSQQPSTSSAYWVLDFKAHYLGSPYIGPSGKSPNFKCDPFSPTAVCKWQ